MSEKPYEAMLHYTEPVLRKSAFMLWRRHAALGTALWVGLSTLTLPLMWLTQEEPRNMWIMAGASVVGLVLSRLVYVLCYRALVGYSREQGSFSMQVRLEEASLFFQGGMASSTLPWVWVKELLKTREIWLLLLANKGQVFVFPLADIPLEVQVFLEARLRAAGAKVKAL
ncbi:MAG: hypothetical protein FWG75_03180 [Cystobacterineae bacterium]|nr:hypothetical protein [Cystobacterineae bacterium]